LSPTEQNLSARIGVTAVFFANGFAIGSWAVAIPLVRALYGLSDGELSVALLAAGVGSLSAMPIAALLPPKLGGTGATLKITAPISALLLAALPLFGRLPFGFELLMLVGFVFGVFNILVDVPMNAHASVVERGFGKPIMSSFHAAWSCGGLGGSALGGFLIESGASAPLQLGIEAAIILAIAIWAPRRIGVGDTHAPETIFVMPEGKLIALGIIALLAVFSEASVTDWSALYLSRELGWTPGAAAWGFSAYAGMMFLSRLLGDGVIGRLGRSETILYGSGLILLGAGLAVGLATPWAAVVGFCLVGVGVANMIPAAFSASAAAAPTPSIGVAMTATVAYASYLLGPPLIGFVASASSLRTAFALLIVAGVAIAALALGQRTQG
jgi:MFS family permease